MHRPHLRQGPPSDQPVGLEHARQAAQPRHVPCQLSLSGAHPGFPSTKGVLPRNLSTVSTGVETQQARTGSPLPGGARYLVQGSIYRRLHGMYEKSKDSPRELLSGQRSGGYVTSDPCVRACVQYPRVAISPQMDTISAGEGSGRGSEARLGRTFTQWGSPNPRVELSGDGVS